PAEVGCRASGTHWWPYWQFELHRSRPQVAKALDVAPEAPDCRATGAIGDLAHGVDWLGRCVTPEYDVPGGRAQDFVSGRVFWSEGTGAKLVAGAIGGAYQKADGPGGSLGLPTTHELATPDGHGRYNAFRNGSIYWTPETGAHPVEGAVLDKWGSLGWEAGVLGYPTSDPRKMQGGSGTAQDFQVGSIYAGGDGAYEVQGAIRDKYNAMDAEGGEMGAPTTDELTTPNGAGKFNRFDKGIIYWTADTGAWSI